LVESEDDSARTYLATTAFLNVFCVVFIPAGLFFAHAGLVARCVSFLAFAAFSTFSLFVLVRNFLKEGRRRLSVFAAASFIAMVIIGWLCIWPSVPRTWAVIQAYNFIEPALSFVAKQHNRALDRLVGYLFLTSAVIGYLLLFLPIMLAAIANQQWSETKSTFSARLKIIGVVLGNSTKRGGM